LITSSPIKTVRFHTLPISRLERPSADSVCLSFAIPAELRDEFRFTPGQFLTLKAQLGEAELRRNYSICSSLQHFEAQSELSIAIKRVEGGAFSSYALESLEEGMQLAVQKPDGRFTQRSAGTRFVGIAAGSGITPILSLIESSLRADQRAQWLLIYGNQRTQSMMFGEKLADLKDEFAARFAVFHSFSKQHQETPIANGRIDASKLKTLVELGVLDLERTDEVFICGPEGLIEESSNALSSLSPKIAAKIRSERFSSALGSASTAFVATKNIATNAHGMIATSSDKARVIPLQIIEAGKTHHLELPEGAAILDTALAAGLDLPYACKGGVCCTCRAKVLEGKLEMKRNFTLEQDEVEAGFVLTCQACALPNTERVVLSFDER
jgi:ring-1,2-phenylacetyl-CoA epoxidase subunit PaaE